MDILQISLPGLNSFSTYESAETSFFIALAKLLKRSMNFSPNAPSSLNRKKSHHLDNKNKLLMTLLWLKTYPTCTTHARNFFGVSVSSSWRMIRLIWPILHRVCRKNMFWLSNREWRSLRGSWKKLPEAVGAIDGTSYRIYLPSNELQQLYYSGYRKYQSIHTQIVIAADLRICHMESGFIGHNNDAETFRMMTPIGVGRVLAFPRDCYLFGDSIYPFRHPIVTSFSSAQ
jgi:hypothetical protein